jgi:hypothetical protein
MAVTAIHSLNKPTAGTKPWTTDVNANWDIIDGMYSATNTVPTAGIANNAVDGTKIELLNNVGLEQKDFGGTARVVLNINASDITILNDSSGNELLEAAATASAVNHLEITNAATGNNPMLSSAGSDSNVGLILGDSNDNEVVILESTASAVNEVTITNKATGVAPTIQSTGESDIGLDLLDSNSNELLDLVSVASAVNELKVTNSATGNPVLVEAGGETNVNLDIKSKGTGELGLFTNGVEAVNIDQNGAVTQPLNPCFTADMSVDQSNITGNGTEAVVIFNTERFDQGSDYSTSTGIFTAPKTGKYLFTATLLLEGITSPRATSLNLIASNVTFRNEYPDIDNSESITITMIVDMDSGDTAKVAVKVSGEAGDSVDVSGGSPGRSYFSGTLIA